MNLKQRIKKEKITLPLVLKGYSRTMANAWYGKTQYDLRRYKNEFGTDAIEHWHKKGYLCESIKRYNLIDNYETDYITDFQYLYMMPFNNSFGKWLEDILTTQRVLLPFAEHFRNVYFSIIRREGKPLILRVGHEDREYTVEDIMELLREKGSLELRPAFWNSGKRRRTLTLGIDEETGDEVLYSNGYKASESWLQKTIRGFSANYVIADPVPISFAFREDLELDHALKVWIANDAGDGPAVLGAQMNCYYNDEAGKRKNEVALVDLAGGTFEFLGDTLAIPNWEGIKAELCRVAAAMPQLTFFTASVALSPMGGFSFLRFSNSPKLPDVPFNKELDNYLKDKFKKQFRKRTLADRIKGLRDKRLMKHVKKHGRKGIRPYMHKQWMDAKRADLLHTKGVPLKTKLWAHKHGFLSFRTYQYGLTKENYLRYLSDYDYYWLNRINNDYQKWVNDKTTYRYVMEPYKQYVPKYYFSCFKRDGKLFISKMWDCPADVPEGFEGMTEMLRRSGKLAFKASAGTHGDGFYCLSYEDGKYFINGKESSEQELKKTVENNKSFYVVTEYLEMNDELKKIYAKSVNTVRIMVINAHGYDPKIMQTYMRIGSEKTGYTDNVGYGGVCAMINKETGELYQPEQLVKHRYIPCPVHPDTGTPIAGKIPNWEIVKEKVPEICRYFAELEYLGFDVAITNEGFQILEINIHQDLHKVAEFTDEINEFFRRKMKLKGRQ